MLRVMIHKPAVALWNVRRDTRQGKPGRSRRAAQVPSTPAPSAQPQIIADPVLAVIAVRCPLVVLPPGTVLIGVSALILVP